LKGKPRVLGGKYGVSEGKGVRVFPFKTLSYREFLFLFWILIDFRIPFSGDYP